MRASTDIALKDRQTLTLEDFKGVDFSSSPHRVAANRAADAVNVIYEDGEVKKRKGWQQKGVPLDGKINGIFDMEFVTDEGETVYHTLIHVGKKIYVKYRTNSIRWSVYNPELLSNDDMTVKDARSSFFMNNGYCYIVCGDILVYGEFDGKYQLKRLVDIGVYIPTTTINIDADGTEDTQVAVLESPNILTSWRRNTLVGGTDSSAKEYYLDSKIIKNSDIVVEIIKGTEKIRLTNRYTGTLEATGEVEETSEKKYLCDEEGIIWGLIRWRAIINYVSRESVGAIYFLKNVNSIDGEANITVTFMADGEDKRAEITGCTFGTIFGTNGSSNRLFLSGNASCPNRVFYSGYNDFTYFPDVNYINVGSETAKITGFCRLLDNTVAILKEKSLTDPTIYYMTGVQENEYDSSGNLTDGKAVFYVEGGGVGEANINPYVTANLAGDALMLSENGVLGITLTQNMTTGARYVKERSYSINDRLRLYDLSDAAGIVFENRYYLSVGGVCFVADARHKYYREGNDMDQSYNYEWWYWENVPARVWAVVDGKLWFGTEDGKLCAFDTDGYEDITFLNIADGNATTSTNGGDEIKYVVASSELLEHVKNGAYIQGPILAEIFYNKVFTSDDIDSNGYISVGEELISRLTIGDTLHFVYTDSEGFDTTFDAIVVAIDTMENKFKTRYGSMLEMYAYSMYGEDVYNENGEFELFEGIDGLTVGDQDSIRILYDLQYKPHPIINVTDKCFQIEAPWGGAFVFSDIQYGTEESSVDVYEYDKSPVSAKWITPYFDMGSSMYGKTLLRLSVTAGEGSDTFLFGYETKRDSSMRPIHGTQHMDFNSFSFNAFSFNNNFASSHTVKTNVRNFNYIRFCFLSEDAVPFSISSLQALYKINKMNRGVR